MEMQDKVMIHILDGTEWDDGRFHHAVQSGTQFKTCELFLEFTIEHFRTAIDCE